MNNLPTWEELNQCAWAGFACSEEGHSQEHWANWRSGQPKPAPMPDYADFLQATEGLKKALLDGIFASNPLFDNLQQLNQLEQLTQQQQSLGLSQHKLLAQQQLQMGQFQKLTWSKANDPLEWPSADTGWITQKYLEPSSMLQPGGIIKASIEAPAPLGWQKTISSQVIIYEPGTYELLYDPLTGETHAKRIK